MGASFFCLGVHACVCVKLGVVRIIKLGVHNFTLLGQNIDLSIKPNPHYRKEEFSQSCINLSLTVYSYPCIKIMKYTPFLYVRYTQKLTSA